MTDRLINRTQAYVNGQWVDSTSGNTLAVYNPASGAHLADVPDMSAAEASAAVEAAHKTFASWKTTTAKERSRAAAPLV